MRLKEFLATLSQPARIEFRRRLAQRAGVSGQTVSNWVCGRQRPTPERARIIARETGGKIALEDMV